MWNTFRVTSTWNIFLGMILNGEHFLIIKSISSKPPFRIFNWNILTVKMILTNLTMIIYLYISCHPSESGFWRSQWFPFLTFWRKDYPSIAPAFFWNVFFVFSYFYFLLNLEPYMTSRLIFSNFRKTYPRFQPGST